jgi:hypothetical protein
MKAGKDWGVEGWLLVTSLAAAGCESTQPARPPALASARAASSRPNSGGSEPSPAGSRLKTARLEIPRDTDPNNHHLAKDTMFASDCGTTTAFTAKQLTPAGTDGTAQFQSHVNGAKMVTKCFWRTAKPVQELSLGQLALALDKRNQHIHAAPVSPEESYGKLWKVGRVVSLSALGEGYLWLAGGLRVAPEAARLAEGDATPTIPDLGAEDSHWVQEGHYFASYFKPQRGEGQVVLALPTGQPATVDGKRQFLGVMIGALFVTRHFWQTRQATRAELTPGQRVFVVDRADQGIFRPPGSREEALFSNWRMLTITNTRDLKDGMVTLGTNGRARVEALRVPR